MDDMLTIRVEQDGQGPIVRLEGEIDLDTAERMRQSLIEQDDPILTVDFSGVTFMGSSGVNVLVAVQKHVREHAGKLVLCGVRPSQMRVFTTLGMADYFDCIATD